MDTSGEEAAAAEEVACHDCAQVQTLPALGLHSLARCVRCDAVLDRAHPPDYEFADLTGLLAIL